MAQSNNLLFVFLVLLLCSTLCVSVCADSTEENGVLETNVFKSGAKITQVQTLTDSKKINITPEKINPPALFAAAKDGVIVVIAETMYKKNGDATGVGNGEPKVDVVSRTFVRNSQVDWGEKVFKDEDKKNWKTQLVTENNEKEKDFSKIMASTVNKDRSKIYVFLLNNTEQGSDKKWNFKLVEGAVNGVKAGEKTIKWDKESLNFLDKDDEIKKKVNKDGQDLPLTDGSVFLTEKEEEPVFVFKGKFTGTGDGVVKSVIIFFQLKKQDTGKNVLELLKAKSVEGLYSVFKWKDKIFRTPTNNPSGDQSNEVMVLNASNNFESSADPIARLRDFLKDKSNFATTTIGEDDTVLLFTQQKTEQNKNNVYSWMFDGTRVVNTGIIASIESAKTFYGSVLQTKTELFALYQTYETEDGTSEENNKIHLTMLKTQLVNITKTLDAWKNNGEKIKEFYKDIPTVTTSRITDGLVGFLSNTEDNKQWKDEYLNVNATVHVSGEIKKMVTVRLRLVEKAQEQCGQ